MAVGGADPKASSRIVGNDIKVIDRLAVAELAETGRGFIGPAGSRIATVLIDPVTAHDLAGSVATWHQAKAVADRSFCGSGVGRIQLRRAILFVGVALPGAAQVGRSIQRREFSRVVIRRLGEVVDVMTVAAANDIDRIKCLRADCRRTTGVVVGRAGRQRRAAGRIGGVGRADAAILVVESGGIAGPPVGAGAVTEPVGDRSTTRDAERNLAVIVDIAVAWGRGGVVRASVGPPLGNRRRLSIVTAPAEFGFAVHFTTRADVGLEMNTTGGVVDPDDGVIGNEDDAGAVPLDPGAADKVAVTGRVRPLQTELGSVDDCDAKGLVVDLGHAGTGVNSDLVARIQVVGIFGGDHGRAGLSDAADTIDDIFFLRMAADMAPGAVPRHLVSCGDNGIITSRIADAHDRISYMRRNDAVHAVTVVAVEIYRAVPLDFTRRIAGEGRVTAVC